jgi:hypothetical protein
MEAFIVFVLGWILVAFGALLLFLNNAGRRWDSPEAQQTTGWIALVFLILGFVILLFAPR